MKAGELIVRKKTNWDKYLNGKFKEFYGIDYIVEKKLERGWDVIIYFKDQRKPVSLIERLPKGWILAKYCGSGLYSDLAFCDRFLPFYDEKIVVYDDITRDDGLIFLLEIIEEIKIGVYKNKSSQLRIGSCVYKSSL